MNQNETNAAEGASLSNAGLAADLSRFMSYAYQRGRLDALGMLDGPEKESIVKAVGNLEAARWATSARLLLEMASANDPSSSAA